MDEITGCKCIHCNSCIKTVVVYDRKPYAICTLCKEVYVPSMDVTKLELLKDDELKYKILDDNKRIFDRV